MLRKLLTFLFLISILSFNSYSFDNSTLKPEYQSLLQYYEFNTNSIDSTGKYNGTDANFPTYTGSSVDFDGVNDYIGVTSYSHNNPTGLTINLWANFDDLSGSNHMINLDDGNYNSRVYRLWYQTGNFWFALGNGDGSPYTCFINDGGTTTTGTFHMITATYDGSTMKMYIDGSQVGSNVPCSNNIPNNSETLYIGASDPFNTMNGSMRDLSIYNNALNQSVINDLYNNVDMFSDLLDIQGVGIQINNPVDQFNYTYDVTSLLFNITTSDNASCDYEYLGVNTSMTTTDNVEHTITFDLGNQTNVSNTYDINFYCDNGIEVSSESTTFYRQQEPLDLEIVVPQDQQIFVASTEEIQFYVVTNYVASCSYNVNDAGLVPFTSTNSSIHTTIYNVNSSILTYNSYFECEGTFLSEDVNKSVIFYLDDLLIAQGGYVQVLEDSGKGLGNFFNSVGTPLINVLVPLGIGVAIILMIGGIARGIGRNIIKLSK